MYSRDDAARSRRAICSRGDLRHVLALEDRGRGTRRRPRAAGSSRRRTRARACGSGSSAPRPSSGRPRSASRASCASIGCSLPSSSVWAEAVEDAVDAVAGEQAHEVVLGGQVEARLARVALATGAAAQLVVDAARLVALGAEDEEAARLHHLLAVLGSTCSSIFGNSSSQAAVPLVGVRLEAALASSSCGQVLRVAAELDVHAAAGHVGGDRDRARAARLGDRSRPRARRARAWRSAPCA